jgi:hypothetical protein
MIHPIAKQSVLSVLSVLDTNTATMTFTMNIRITNNWLKEYLMMFETKLENSKLCIDI